MLCLAISLQWVIPTKSLALSNGIFFNYTGSQKLVEGVKYYSVNFPKLEQKYNICQEQVTTVTKNLSTTELLLDGANKDKKLYLAASKEFEEKYTKTYNKLTDCEGAKPSRFTWFAIGGLTTAILTSVLIVFIKK